MVRPPDKMRFRDEGEIIVKDKARESLFRRRKEARPGELVRAALDTFVEKGFAATRLEDLATRAGVSKGTIYLYIESKEVLFKAVIEAGLAPALEAVKAVTAPAAKIDRPAIELLRSYCDVWQRIMRETPMASLLKLLVAESGNFPEVVQWFADSVVRPAKTAMANIVAAGIARGDFRPIPIEVAADIFLSLMWQCAFNKVWCGLPSPERFLEEALEVLTHGVASVPAK
jgi:AcrR family transcriptional regulator